MLEGQKMTRLRNNTTLNRKRFMLLIFACFSLSACASNNEAKIIDSGNVIYDPYEEMNRTFMSFNLAVDHAVVNPVIRGYRTVAPLPARTGIRNFLRNLRTPITLGNQLLQGDATGAGNTTLRAIINTTVGVGGVFDVAGHEGIEYEQEDFGQTLAVWGVGHGPYMVVPFIGASSLRDYSGYLGDSLADPVSGYLANRDEHFLNAVRFGVGYLDIRDSLYETLTELEKSSFDYYAAVRSTYYQHRRALENDNNPATSTELPDIPEFDFEDDF